MDQLDAELIAAKALQFVASDEDLLARFLAISGMGPDDLRQNLAKVEFLTGVLGFVLDHEPDAAAFCAFAELPPGQALKARATLSGQTEE